ncbi:DUF4224 domain-containing protein [Polaromonas sp.]|uniref:DUF4224 domain-containing protein n=1 Tax=Polaromonas sp. TaxID=1869339 RepID=UPI003267B3DF
MSDTLLTPAEVAELTGVKIGKNGLTREQLQAQALKAMNIPHYVNARDEPKVVRAVLEGGKPEPKKKAAWEPGRRPAHA